MKINVHAGHNRVVQGANKYLNEVTEDRIVKNKVISLLRQEGHIVYDCTDELGKTQNNNLKNIVTLCNAHKVDLDVSLHLNAGGGMGVEVYCYDTGTKSYATRIVNNISKSLDIRNRGVKYDKGLYVLKNTKAPALLIECCFVDSKTDKEHWNADKCAKAIVEGILNKTIMEDKDKPSESKTSFLVKVTDGTLNIREAADPNSKVKGCIKDKGAYTIVETKKSKDGGNWGRLKSGQGWINLYYTKRI